MPLFQVTTFHFPIKKNYLFQASGKLPHPVSTEVVYKARKIFKRTSVNKWKGFGACVGVEQSSVCADRTWTLFGCAHLGSRSRSASSVEADQFLNRTVHRETWFCFSCTHWPKSARSFFRTAPPQDFQRSQNALHAALTFLHDRRLHHDHPPFSWTKKQFLDTVSAIQAD